MKAATYYARDDDGLGQEWRGRVWLNYPWSAGFRTWSRKFFEEWAAGRMVAGCIRARRDDLARRRTSARRQSLVSPARPATQVLCASRKQVRRGPVRSLAHLLWAGQEEVRVRLRGGWPRVPGAGRGEDRRHGRQTVSPPEGESRRQHVIWQTGKVARLGCHFASLPLSGKCRDWRSH